MRALPPQSIELRVVRYFISTTNHVMIMDEEGVELSSREALGDLLRRALIEILRDEGDLTGVNEYSAHAYDESGRRVLSARVCFSLTDQ